jgi:hypothetical protein
VILTYGGLTMKLTIIFAGILAVSSLAVAQGPTVITGSQTNQVRQLPVLPGTSQPQQSAVTNQTAGANATNAPSSTATSTNASSASTSTNASNPSATSHPVTILRGSDPMTAGNNPIPPQKDSGLDPVRSTAGTPDDWRSGATTHIIPPRDPGSNP